ncbi:MAG: hypothetical protein MZW92_40810 [Comamonadaceae bacterium]|nr:hypothetical protein [Comamonadaceae bacterium]
MNINETYVVEPKIDSPDTGWTAVLVDDEDVAIVPAEIPINVGTPPVITTVPVRVLVTVPDGATTAELSLRVTSKRNSKLNGASGLTLLEAGQAPPQPSDEIVVSLAPANALAAGGGAGRCAHGARWRIAVCGRDLHRDHQDAGRLRGESAHGRWRRERAVEHAARRERPRISRRKRATPLSRSRWASRPGPARRTRRWWCRSGRRAIPLWSASFASPLQQPDFQSRRRTTSRHNSNETRKVVTRAGLALVPAVALPLAGTAHAANTNYKLCFSSDATRNRRRQRGSTTRRGVPGRGSTAPGNTSSAAAVPSRMASPRARVTQIACTSRSA